MNELTQEKIMQGISLLASKLGVASEHLWIVLLKQAYVESASSIFCLSVCWIIIYKATRPKVIGWVNKKIEENVDPARIAYFIILPTFALIVFIITLSASCNIFTALINPEYWALKEILKVLH